MVIFNITVFNIFRSSVPSSHTKKIWLWQISIHFHNYPLVFEQTVPIFVTVDKKWICGAKSEASALFVVRLPPRAWRGTLAWPGAGWPIKRGHLSAVKARDRDAARFVGAQRHCFLFQLLTRQLRTIWWARFVVRLLGSSYYRHHTHTV